MWWDNRGSVAERSSVDSPDRIPTYGARAKVFDLSPNAPIIVAGADADGRICALEAGTMDTLTSTSQLGVGDARVRQNAEGRREGRTTLGPVEMQAMRKEIEDLIGLEDYYAIEAETVERS
jgi:hypothetical protein